MNTLVVHIALHGAAVTTPIYRAGATSVTASGLTRRRVSAKRYLRACSR